MSFENKVGMIYGANSITVFFEGKSYSFTKDTPNYGRIVTALKNKDLDALRVAVDIRKEIVGRLSGKAQIVDGQLHFDGKPLHNAIATRIVNIFREGLDVTPLINFLNNLMENPSKRAVDELYGFLEACNLPITPDGHFLAYKRVREDYLDIHSGTILNRVGDKPSMPRNQVDDVARNTCSQGLHFCSESYLPHFGAGSGNRVMILKVNPRDVVSIPVDYNHAKGRACLYEVVGEIETGRAGELINRLPENYTNNFGDDDSDWEDDDCDTDGDDCDTDGDDTPANPSAKLTESSVRQIRNMLADGLTLRAIGEAFNISPRQVARIRDGEAWAHV